MGGRVRSARVTSLQNEKSSELAFAAPPACTLPQVLAKVNRVLLKRQSCGGTGVADCPCGRADHPIFKRTEVAGTGLIGHDRGRQSAVGRRDGANHRTAANGNAENVASFGAGCE